jgi:hypothetical protein
MARGRSAIRGLAFVIAERPYRCPQHPSRATERHNRKAHPVDLEWNDDGLEKLQRQLEEQFSGGIEAPLGGSEEDAVRSVKEQLVAMGTAPNDAEIAKMVREVREAY